MISGRKSIFGYAGICALLLSVFSFVFTTASAQAVSPAGYWKTFDEHTNQPRSIVQIWMQNGQLQGRLAAIYFQPGEGPKDLCVKCAPPRKNEKILGMTILWGMVPTGQNQWGNGQVLDPKIGQVYRCKMTLSADGRTLNVRGYVGVSLFGRTQTWVRVSSVKG